MICIAFTAPMDAKKVLVLQPSLQANVYCYCSDLFLHEVIPFQCLSVTVGCKRSWPLLHQSGISIDTTGTTHLAGYSCITGLRCGSIEVSSLGDLEKMLSENLQEMFPYSCRNGHVPRRNSQKSFRIPNHPVKRKSLTMLQTKL